MDIGRRIIIDKITNKVVYDFGERSGDVLARPDIKNLQFIDLEFGEYKEEFLNLKDGLNSIKIIDLDKKIFEFDLKEKEITPEEKIINLENELLLKTNSDVGGIL